MASERTWLYVVASVELLREQEQEQEQELLAIV